jgi:hypothetical protein
MIFKMQASNTVLLWVCASVYASDLHPTARPLTLEKDGPDKSEEEEGEPADNECTHDDAQCCGSLVVTNTADFPCQDVKTHVTLNCMKKFSPCILVYTSTPLLPSSISLICPTWSVMALFFDRTTRRILK